MLFPSAILRPDGQENLSKVGTFKYWALSYWWGKPEDVARNKITIYYDTGARGKRQKLDPMNRFGTFYIRDNLQAALLTLRHPEDDVNVWVDALSINQEDRLEKNAQVARMHEVYAQAENVCVWLGEGNEHTQETFEFLQEILNLQQLDDLVADPIPTARRWALIVKLMTNRWFSRRWVIQELALSRQATVRWGTRDLSWSDFADAIALFMTKYEEIKRTSLDPADHFRGTDARALGANTIVHATMNLFRKSPEGLVQQRLLPLEILVSSLLLAFEASEPRDTVFAVLTLAKDSQFSSLDPGAKDDPRIAPDYDKCLLDVYADFIDYCIDKSHSLDIICRYWALLPKKPSLKESLRSMASSRTDTQEMPSWVPIIKYSAFGEPDGVVRGRANGDSLVGGSERKGQLAYNASAGLRAWHKFGTYESVNPIPKVSKRSKTFPANLYNNTRGLTAEEPPKALPPTIHGPTSGTNATNASHVAHDPSTTAHRYDGTLSVKGFCLDTVERVSGRVMGSGIIPSDALELGGWVHDGPEDQKVPDKLWRTLVGDRGPNGTSAPGWYRRTCLECLQHTDRQGDLDTETLKNTASTSSTQITFLEKVQPLVWGRRFFETSGRLRSQEPLFGLGGSNVKTGDVVCILFGCSVPVVLRKLSQGKDPDYAFIGECYLHGMMDGEAIPGKLPTYPYWKKCTTFRMK